MTEGDDCSKDSGAALLDDGKSAGERKESLNRPLVGLLIMVSIVFAGISYASQKLVVLKAFDRIERDGANRDLARCESGLRRDLELLDNFVNDWAAWDETYDYVAEPNDEYRETNLIVETFENGQLNLIALFNRTNELVWGEGRDTESLELIDISDVCAKISDPSTRLTDFRDVDDSKVGVILSDLGPMLIAIRPIITSKRETPIRGTLAMGRLLTPLEISNLADRAQVKLNLWVVGDDDMPEVGREMITQSAGAPGEPNIFCLDS
ncbi:MAG: hypothetical protein O3C21_13850, partial [Verrucomicrobia bacterium]|nr:hypothetical protein [Verrucomicrobiota bacterium]